MGGGCFPFTQTYNVLFCLFSAVRCKRKSIPGFFSPQSSTTTSMTTSISGPSVPSCDTATVTPRTLAGGNQTLKAELLWAMKCVDFHYSFHSCEGISELFKQMFPGDPVAQTFTCGETKCRYLCQFGIAPYFYGLLKKSARTDSDYVLLFDESLNKKTQSKQMDILIRQWNHDHVQSRYFTSKFIGHATADNVVEHFSSATEDLNYNGLLQISMDGPSVNWSFYEKFGRKLKENNDSELINIGSCGLHVLHGAFQTGFRETGWNVDGLLSSMYYLFKDCPARREDYVNVTGSTDFPLKFCKHRWLENGPVSSRAAIIWNNFKIFVEAVNKKKVSRPNNMSFSVVRDAINDPLILAKLSFFNSVSREVEPFLQQYQTDKVMVPFLVSDLEKVMRNLMSRFINSDPLESAVSITDMLKINLSQNLLDKKKIQIGFKAESELKKLKSSKIISERQAFEFRDDCRKCLIRLVEKISERSPLRYSIARNLSCLDPRSMAKQAENCKKQMRRLLELLVKIKRVNDDDVDDLNRAYNDFLRDVVANGDDSARFRDFDVSKDLVDKLLYETMGTDKIFHKLWTVVRKMLLLSHGQASVERGFSVNRQIETENMSEGMLVALRTISDHLTSIGGISNVQISKELLCSASGARQKYHHYLEEEKCKKVREQVNLKRKAAVDEIDQMKKKSKTLNSDIYALEKSVVKFADDAETTHGATSHSLIVKSNSLRRTTNEKIAELKSLLLEIDAKTKSLE